MKFWKNVMKNFKILFRRKTSLIAVILGPLLIIALIGFAFSSTSQFDIRVGYTDPDGSVLTGEFVSSLSEQYSVNKMTSKEECVSQIEQGMTHICIFFPENFVIENDRVNNITFVVDKARVNIVYSILADVNDKIGVKSDQLSKDLTETLISTLESTSGDIDTNLGALIRLKKSVEDSQSEVTTISTDLKSIDLTTESVDTNVDDFISDIDSDAKSIRDESISMYESGMDIVSDLRAQITNTTLLALLDDLEADLDNLNETAVLDYASLSDNVQDLEEKISSVVDSISSLNDKISSADSRVEESLSALNSVKDDLNTIISDIDSIKQSMEKSSQGISQIKVTSTDQIVNPIQTKIETVASDSNNLAILFPYVLLLIIMFVGLMLSSTLVMVEKKSKAYFRVFTTPTKDEFYLWTTFFTSFSIVALQVTAILLIMKLVNMDLIGANLWVNLVLLGVSISMFVMIGMAIGYIMTHQQGANMMSITIGAIFLFISNMVLPLESISPYLKEVAQFNPYVLTSEMLRKSILFNADFTVMFTDLGILLSYTIIIAMTIIIVQGIAKNNFFRNIPHIKSKKKVEKELFTIKGVVIDSEKQLISAVQELTNEEFVVFVKKSVLAKKFIKESLNHPEIAKRLKKFKKKDFVEAISKKNELAIESIKKPKKSKNKK